MNFSQIVKINSKLDGETKDITIEGVGDFTLFEGQNPIVLSKDADILIYDDRVRLKASPSDYMQCLEWIKRETPGRPVEVEVMKTHKNLQSVKVVADKLKEEGANPAFIRRFKEEAKLRPQHKVIRDDNGRWEYVVVISSTYLIIKSRRFMEL